ncbi:MAG TPA: hypothetical protein PLZ08_09565 [Bacillota bacterium]|nr:hypothetical protein [Bacillota bacterium]HOL09728.1 hypothetical protein [Bacillota bacterium]HPO98185.1 hypothetical protein [Bacillota bacterium]
MNRKQALEHFKSGPLKEKGIEKMDQVNEYFKIHKEELVPDFVESFRSIPVINKTKL